ncbi:hypothetical protein Hanom_Chr03g00202331 [Helianthus anomalus]
MFAGVLRNLGIDPDEKIPKRVSKKKVIVARGTTVKETKVTDVKSDAASRKGTAQFRQSSLEDFIYVVDSFEELYAIGEKAQGSASTDMRSLGSTGSVGPESGTTPTSIHVEEPEANIGHVELIR